MIVGPIPAHHLHHHHHHSFLPLTPPSCPKLPSTSTPAAYPDPIPHLTPSPSPTPSSSSCIPPHTLVLLLQPVRGPPRPSSLLDPKQPSRSANLGRLASCPNPTVYPATRPHHPATAHRPRHAFRRQGPAQPVLRTSASTRPAPRTRTRAHPTWVGPSVGPSVVSQPVL